MVALGRPNQLWSPKRKTGTGVFFSFFHQKVIQTGAKTRKMKTDQWYSFLQITKTRPKKKTETQFFSSKTVPLRISRLI